MTDGQHNLTAIEPGGEEHTALSVGLYDFDLRLPEGKGSSALRSWNKLTPKVAKFDLSTKSPNQSRYIKPEAVEVSSKSSVYSETTEADSISSHITLTDVQKERSSSSDESWKPSEVRYSRLPGEQNKKGKRSPVNSKSISAKIMSKNTGRSCSDDHTKQTVKRNISFSDKESEKELQTMKQPHLKPLPKSSHSSKISSGKAIIRTSKKPGRPQKYVEKPVSNVRTRGQVWRTRLRSHDNDDGSLQSTEDEDDDNSDDNSNNGSSSLNHGTKKKIVNGQSHLKPLPNSSHSGNISSGKAIRTTTLGKSGRPQKLVGKPVSNVQTRDQAGRARLRSQDDDDGFPQSNEDDNSSDDDDDSNDSSSSLDHGTHTDKKPVNGQPHLKPLPKNSHSGNISSGKAIFRTRKKPGRPKNKVEKPVSNVQTRGQAGRVRLRSQDNDGSLQSTEEDDDDNSDDDSNDSRSSLDHGTHTKNKIVNGQPCLKPLPKSFHSSNISSGKAIIRTSNKPGQPKNIVEKPVSNVQTRGQAGRARLRYQDNDDVSLQSNEDDNSSDDDDDDFLRLPGVKTNNISLSKRRSSSQSPGKPNQKRSSYNEAENHGERDVRYTQRNRFHDPKMSDEASSDDSDVKQHVKSPRSASEKAGKSLQQSQVNKKYTCMLLEHQRLATLSAMGNTDSCESSQDERVDLRQVPNRYSLRQHKDRPTGCNDKQTNGRTMANSIKSSKYSEADNEESESDTGMPPPPLPKERLYVRPTKLVQNRGQEQSTRKNNESGRMTGKESYANGYMQSSDVWKEEEIFRLSKALHSLAPNAPRFWPKVSQSVQTRSAQECMTKYQEQLQHRNKKVQITVKHMPPKQKVLALTGGVGTIKRKRELRQLLEQQDDGYEDDIFDSTPFKKSKKHFMFPVEETEDDYEEEEEEEGEEYEEYEEESPTLEYKTPSSRTPSSRHRPLGPASCSSTPSADFISPSLLQQVNRNDMDLYIHRMKQGKRAPRIQHARQQHAKVVKTSTPIKNNRRLAKLPLMNSTMFEVQQVTSDQDSEEEEDYYWSDE